MVSRVPIPLRLYRFGVGLASPLTPLLLGRRLRRGKEQRARLRERRGHPAFDRPPGPLVWLHAASVGELASAIPLIERIRARHVDVLVTSGTVTSATLAEQRLPRGVIHQYVPLDVPGYVRRFLAHWQPDLGLLVESDLWPNLILESAARNVPLILVNARLSNASFRRWRFFPRSIAALLDRLDLCLARTPADAKNYGDLGAPRVIVTGNLKFDVPALPALDDRLAPLRSTLGNRMIFGAASTHPGEETILAQVHRRLRAEIPNLLTVIAPRHPERGRGLVEIAAAAGLKAAQRSRGEMPDVTTDIYIADTLGELGLLYRLAPVVFIGGSLVRHGGQNPIEAAQLGAAILHGPHVGNFAEIYQALDASNGAEEIEDGAMLMERARVLLGDADARALMADTARKTIDSLGGALERTLQALDPYLMQIRLGPRIEQRSHPRSGPRAPHA